MRLPLRLVLTPLLGVLAALCVVTSTSTVAAAAPIATQITPIDDEPGTEAPGLGNIVGSPEAGPEPEDAGDRGGWAQLALAGVLVGAVLFIGSRILAEARSGREAMNSRADPPSPDAR